MAQRRSTLLRSRESALPSRFQPEARLEKGPYLWCNQKNGSNDETSSADMCPPPPTRSWISLCTSSRLPNSPGLVLGSHRLKLKASKLVYDSSSSPTLLRSEASSLARMGAMRESWDWPRRLGYRTVVV